MGGKKVVKPSQSPMKAKEESTIQTQDEIMK